MNVSAPTGRGDDDYWRRPDEEAAAPEPTTEPARQAGPAPYQGPPPTAPPPGGWRPPFVAEPQPPRALPPQDLAAIDAAERSARTVTYGIGMVAGALILVAMCLVCSRLLF